MREKPRSQYFQLIMAAAASSSRATGRLLRITPGERGQLFQFLLNSAGETTLGPSSEKGVGQSYCTPSSFELLGWVIFKFEKLLLHLFTSRFDCSGISVVEKLSSSFEDELICRS